MDNSYKIAVASSDGIVVNQHFGHADKFLIFEVEDDSSFSFIETRAVKPVCNYGDHDDKHLTENLLKIQDCKYLLVSKIGISASMRAEQLGITPMELPDMIEKSIRKLIAEIGLTPNTIFGYQRGIKNIDRIPKAEFNLLVSPWVSVGNMKKMEKKLGIPYLHYPTLPIGAYETSKFLREVGKFAGVDEQKIESIINRPPRKLIKT